MLRLVFALVLLSVASGQEYAHGKAVFLDAEKNATSNETSGSEELQRLIKEGDSPTILKLTSIIMGVSTLMFLLMSEEESKKFNYVAMAVTGIACLAYLAMAYGLGVTQVTGKDGTSRDVYYARYIDWFFTTPFFLLDLCFLAGADNADAFQVMILNALCIAAGALGALNPIFAWPGFIFGMVTFVMFNAKLFGSMASKADEVGGDVKSKYMLVTTFAMLLWCAYPVMFYYCELTHALGIKQEIVVYAILDVLAKCVASFILLSDREVLGEAENHSSKHGGYLLH